MADASKEADASIAEFGNTGVDAALTTAVAMQALNKEASPTRIRLRQALRTLLRR